MLFEIFCEIVNYILTDYGTLCVIIQTIKEARVITNWWYLKLHDFYDEGCFCAFSGFDKSGWLLTARLLSNCMTHQVVINK